MQLVSGKKRGTNSQSALVLARELGLPLNEEEVSFGRSRGTYIFPEDPFMSRAHCKIYHRGEDFYLEDVGSRNGTFVKVRSKTPVPTGATVLVGSQVFRIETN